MASYEIDTKRVKVIASDIQECASQLSLAAGSFHNIKSLISKNNIADLGRYYNNVEITMENQSGKLRQFSSVLSSVTDIYINTETILRGENTYSANKKKEKKGSFLEAVEFQKEVNIWIKKIPKTWRNAAKVLYKKTIGEKVENLDTAYEIWSKCADGKWAEAIGEFAKAVSGDKGKIFVKNIKGGTTFNWTGVKVEAAVKTFTLVMNSDSYIQNNNDKYTDIAAEYLLKGDLAGGTAAIVGDCVQTLGKGFVDVACQTVSATIDSGISAATGGLLTLTTFNDALYDAVGFSPGHMFNDITKTISSGVDYAVDEGLVKGISNYGKMIGNAKRMRFEAVRSLFVNQ